MKRLVLGGGSAQLNLAAVSIQSLTWHYATGSAMSMSCVRMARRQFAYLLWASDVEKCTLLQVKARAEELKRSLDQIAVALEHYAHRIQW